MRPERPRRMMDELWRSSLSVLMSMTVLFVVWQLVQSLIVPLLFFIGMIGVIRLALGFHSRRW